MRRSFLTNGIKNGSAGTGCERYFAVRGLSGTCQITASIFSVFNDKKLVFEIYLFGAMLTWMIHFNCCAGQRVCISIRVMNC